MSSTVIAGLVLLLSATAVVGTGGEWEREREDNIVSRCGGSVADDVGSSECVREEEMVEVKQELAAVKAEMERRVDQLHSQLHYWQNVTVNILKDHYSSIDSM